MKLIIHLFLIFILLKISLNSFSKLNLRNKETFELNKIGETKSQILNTLKTEDRTIKANKNNNMLNNQIKLQSSEKKTNIKNKPEEEAKDLDSKYNSLLNLVIQKAEKFVETDEFKEFHFIKENPNILKPTVITDNDKTYILKYIASNYKTCITPPAKINFVDVCNYYNSGSGHKETDRQYCLNGSCHLCCNQLKNIFKQAAKNSPISIDLGLNGEETNKIIDENIRDDIVANCNKECDITFKLIE